VSLTPVLQAGETLAGYRIEAIAGVGGMGVVYRATQLSLERRVALKVLSSTLVGNDRFRERFRLEGRHAAALDHPNIIPVYEAGESNDLMFIAMRFVDGPTLADMVIQQALSGRETLRILGAIASALDAAHESELVHRDVKPHNILLTAGGHPYLADFGITKGAQSSGLTHSGDFVGSVSYVSPEQIDGRDVTRASDIYSLTAVLFHCLTGTLPYDHDTEAGLMHAHLFAPPPTISGLGIDAPRALDEVFARGMAKRPSDRFDAASELVDACREALAGAELDRYPALVPAIGFGTADDPPEGDPRARDVTVPVAAPPEVAPAPAPVAIVAGAGVLDPEPAPASDATAADRRREMPPPAPPPARQRRRVPALPRADARLPPLPWADLRLPALILAGVLALLGAPCSATRWATATSRPARRPRARRRCRSPTRRRGSRRPPRSAAWASTAPSACVSPTTRSSSPAGCAIRRLASTPRRRRCATRPRAGWTPCGCGWEIAMACATRCRCARAACCG
jgi:predicted Ser/Thr protein kinase